MITAGKRLKAIARPPADQRATRRQKRLRLLALLCGSLWLLAAAFTAPGFAQSRPAEALLPASNWAQGWLREGKVKTYVREDLYTYINGEAELYFPYGFQRLVSATYIKEGQPQTALVADVYQMGSPLEAFGIYAHFRRPEAEEAAVGSSGFVSPSQLMFYQDKYFVQLNASGTAVQDRSVFLALAGAISRRLPRNLAAPHPLDWLRIPAVVPRTEKYMPKSLLGYPFFGRGVTARANLQNQSVHIFIILEGSEASARQTMDRYIAYLKKSGAEYQWMGKDRSRLLSASDPLYKGLLLMPYGRYLLGAAGLQEPYQGGPLIEQMRSRLSAAEK